MHFILPLCSLLVAVATAKPTTPDVAYIDVSVATLWTNPHKPRPVDAPALTNPVHIQRWLNSMTTKQFLNLTSASRTQTQGLYGTRVNILNKHGDWYEVAVNGQPTPKNSLGYPGWVPAAQITFDDKYGKLQSTLPFAEVNQVPLATLYRDAQMEHEIMNVTFATRLPVLESSGPAVKVAVPNGVAYLRAEEVGIFKSASAIPYPTGEDLVETAKMFIGRPYLWGGTSAYAFDCSGYTHTIYDVHGITIARDADAEADFTPGKKVARKDLKSGDLIFYATNLTDPSTIYHVAMYVGNDTMAEAYGAGVPVRFTPVRFNDDYWGAERYLKT